MYWFNIDGRRKEVEIISRKGETNEDEKGSVYKRKMRVKGSLSVERVVEKGERLRWNSNH